MSTERLLILGGGGHGKVVLDAYRLCHPEGAVEVRDDDRTKQGASCLGLSIETPIGAPEALRCACHVAIGDNAIRRRFGVALDGSGSTLVTIVHPRALVATDAKLDRGVFIAAGAIVAPDTRVGAGTILNHAVVIDHDCSIGEWCHIAPGVVLGGDVTVGDESFIGSGAVVLPGVRIGARCVVGAGAVVIRDVPEAATVAGVPAREI